MTNYWMNRGMLVLILGSALPALAQNQASRAELRAKAPQIAAGVNAAEAALTPAELSIAERVYVGLLPCELGQQVDIRADAKSPGYFNVSLKRRKFRMFPVETTSGAVRLEDRKAGVVWVQVSNKSMLMDQKIGQRLADACMSPAQAEVAAAHEKNPPKSFLDAPDSPAKKAD
jgi:hypothetical protein